MNRDTYTSPFSARYASKDMQRIFSDDMKFSTWRKLWLALAESEKELGLNITENQIQQLKANINNLNYTDAEKFEAETRHDVMAHIKAYGLLCPDAKGIIHLGATSCFVGDNADIIIIKEALILVKKKLLKAIKVLKEFALKNKSLPTLGYTHFQPAQVVTVGKRASLWLNDLITDFEDINYVLSSLKLRGAKGTTGTQATYLDLFDNDSEKVKKLEELICEKLGFKEAYPVTGQTYSRKHDARVLNTLSGIAQSTSKFSNDIRLLSRLKEMEEPFGKKQVGSSAMAYKKNPMKSERISSIARYVITTSINPALTASVQWFERTLDDSANRRISIAECFLAIDGILNLYIDIASGMVVYPEVIKKNLNAELPFMATENILMSCVKAGGDRQVLHERIRVNSMEAAKQVKEYGKDNDLIDRIKKDDAFTLTDSELDNILDPINFIGRCPEQVDEFISNYVDPILNSESYEDVDVEVKV